MVEHYFPLMDKCSPTIALNMVHINLAFGKDAFYHIQMAFDRCHVKTNIAQSIALVWVDGCVFEKHLYMI